MSLLPADIAGLPTRLLPIGGRDLPSPDHGKLAAVLVLLYPRLQGIHFVLTARPHTLSRHPGQISLPGGRVEPEDATLWATALRETEEELGINPSLVTPLGRLEEYRLRVSNHLIVPFVGWADTIPAITPDPTEVAEVIEVPLRSLLDPEVIGEEERTLRGQRWSITFYRFGEHRVWGATAHILHGLARHLQTRQWDHPIPGSVRPLEST